VTKDFELSIGGTVEARAIGAQLRMLREDEGMSVGELAARMKWKSQNVSRLERGGTEREPTLSSVNLYLRMLGFKLVLVARTDPTLRAENAAPAKPTKERPARRVARAEAPAEVRQLRTVGSPQARARSGARAEESNRR
jgi:transcriptional regulator with XRE-family HTH domain